MASTTTNSAATKGKGKAIAPFLSYRETIQLVQEFLETAFHTILYLRQIYPPDLFAKRKTYDTVLVYQSRHPTLNEYIGRIIEAIGEELAKGSLKKVALVIKEANLEEKPLERFVFDFGWLFASENRPAEGEDWTPKTNGLSRTDVEHNLRAFLLKLNAADSYLLPLPPPPGVTFGVVIEMNDSASAPESERARRGEVTTEWVPAEERHAPYKMGPEGADGEMDVDGLEGTTKRDDRSTIAPLKSARLGIINVQMMVEELEGKFDLVDEKERKKRLEKASSPPHPPVKAVDRKGKGKAV